MFPVKYGLDSFILLEEFTSLKWRRHNCTGGGGVEKPRNTSGQSGSGPMCEETYRIQSRSAIQSTVILGNDSTAVIIVWI
jgi:hypothetical protein